MVAHEAARLGDGVQGLEALGDDLAGVELVGLLDLFLGEAPHAGDGAIEVVGLRGAVAGDGTTGLGPGHGAV